MFGFSTPINLVLTVALLLAVVLLIPHVRACIQQWRRDSFEEPVLPLSMVRKTPPPGPRNRN
jgi:hypothetical protein